MVITQSISVALPAGRDYAIRMASLADVPAILSETGIRPGSCLVVTDKHVATHYLGPLSKALADSAYSPTTIILPPGEATKSPSALQTIYDAALDAGIDRETPILALGGGVVGDLAGYAAATLLRGLPIVQLPTTLIAQVDSAIGGKTGINHAIGKNLIGAFHQPRVVIADLSTLNTLTEREWYSGLAEVVKHALIEDLELLALLEQQWPAILRRDADVVAEVVFRAAAVKAHIVAKDEREAGRRAVLNFGHTFGHAIERVAGYGRLTHGEAVALGMRAALRVSGTLHADLPVERADRLVGSIPTRHPPKDMPMDALMAAMRADKKVRAGALRLVLLRRLGEAYVTGGVPESDIHAAWAFVCSLG